MDWQNRLDQARDLIQAKEYEAARSLLESIAHPVAAQWLKRLDEIAPPDPNSPAPTADQTPPEAPPEPLRRPDPRRDSPVQPLKSPPPKRSTASENVIRPLERSQERSQEGSQRPKIAVPTNPNVPTNYNYQRPEIPQAKEGSVNCVALSMVMTVMFSCCFGCLALSYMIIMQ